MKQLKTQVSETVSPAPLIIKTNYNGKHLPKSREHFTMPSETIPDEALTINEILTRFSRGLPVTGVKQPVFHGDETYLPDYRSLDLAEIEDWQEQTRNTLKEGESAAERRKLRKAFQAGQQKAKEDALQQQQSQTQKPQENADNKS